MTKTGGFDQTIEVSQDAFGRGALVDDLYARLTELDASWSVRVALHGDWGSGKTSIAEMVAERARRAGHAVGWMYPWRVRSTSGLGLALTLAVLQAVEAAGFQLPPKRAAQKALTRSLELLSRLKGLDRRADMALDMLEDVNAFDAEFAAPIAAMLREQCKRVVVIVDDLDRCEPAFLAPLMLFMRTVLDVPGFSFLAPFDTDVISRTLHAANTAWSNADRFQEKVFDFRVPIPDLTVEQKSRFLLSNLVGAGLLLHDDDVRAAAVLLPGTPRAIKALARDLGAMKRELERRAPEELNWPLLVLVAMLRSTSLEFFRTYRREVGDLGRKADLDGLWELVGPTDASTRHRVRRLVDAILREGGDAETVRRTLHFTDEREPVTLREFDIFVDDVASKGFDTAMARLSNDPQQLAPHLLVRAIQSYQGALGQGQAASLESQREQRAHALERADQCLDIISRLLPLVAEATGGTLLQQSFADLLVFERDTVAPADESASLRARATQLLVAFCETADEAWPHYDVIVEKGLSDDAGPEPQRSLLMRDALQSSLRPLARRALLARLSLPQGLSPEFLSGGYDLGMPMRILLDADDAFWAPDAAPAILLRAAQQAAVRENAAAALTQILKKVRMSDGNWGYSAMLIGHALDTRSRRKDAYTQIDKYASVGSFLAREEMVGALWKAAVTGREKVLSRGSDSDLQATREALLQLGVREELLPLPDQSPEGFVPPSGLAK